MKKTVLIREDQLESIKTNDSALSKNLRPFLFDKVKKHMTSLGDNEAFPPEEDFPFDYKILKERLSSVVDRLQEISTIESYDEEYLSNRLSDCVTKCKQLEEPLRDNLEKICTNVVLRLFDVPNDTVNFTAKLVDEVTPEHQFRIKPEPSSKRKFDFDSLDDFKDANKAVLKRRLINSLIQGASYTYSVNKDLFLQDIYKIDKSLIDLYDEITAINDYLLFVKEEKITDKHPMQGGCVEVMLGTGKDKSSITAQGLIFPFLLHELIKGFLELFASHGLPEDDAKARYIINQADFLIAEPWDLRMGVGLWHFIDKDLTDTSILPYLFVNLCSLDTEEFNTTMQEIFAQTAKGKHLLKHLIDNAEEDMASQGFFSKISLKDSEVALIADDVLSNDDLSSMLSEAMMMDVDKDIFSYPHGKLYNVNDGIKVRQLLVPILGEPIGEGSSRLVFELDDSQVIKVAYGYDDESYAGEQQNRLEEKILTSKQYKNYSLFPKFLYDDNGEQKWIVVEKVIPAEREDFLYLYGLDFDGTTFLDYDEKADDDNSKYFAHDNIYQALRHEGITVKAFVRWAEIKGIHRPRRFDSRDKEFLDLIKNNKYLKELYNVVASHRLEAGDLCRLENWGLTKRDGKPVLVVLDAGLNRAIYNECYYEESVASSSDVINENEESEAIYSLDDNERGDKTFPHQQDYDWKGQNIKDAEQNQRLGLTKKKEMIDTQAKLTNASDKKYKKSPFELRKQIMQRLKDRFKGKTILDKDALAEVGFDTSVASANPDKPTKVQNSLATDFDVSAIGQSFAHGNGKLSGDILIVNLTTSVNCPSSKRGLCAVADVCYAKKGERQYKNKLHNNLRNEIFIPMLSDEEFIEYIEKHIENCKYKTNFIRVNESGDFPSQEFVDRCEKVAEYFYKEYGIQTSCYTCRIDLDFTNCKYMIVNGSSTKVNGADRYYFAVNSNFFSQLPDTNEVFQDKNGNSCFRCLCNCRRCHFCYSTREQNGENENSPTKVYCQIHGANGIGKK